jgi:predicted glycoside hydrolase/deacetylase ChbG (UPF0249 family)
VVELERVRTPFLLELLSGNLDAEFTELGCHPAHVTDDLHSSYSGEREVELATLTEPELQARIEGLGLTLASYHDWRARASRPAAG